jgi:DNA uptake protein ComE-like DNA-binding protein
MKAAGDKMSKSAASGLVALVFLVLGFQLAIFVVKVIERPQAGEAAGDSRGSEHSSCEQTQISEQRSERNDDSRSIESGTSATKTKLGGYARPAVSKPTRTYESFPFNPNTVTVDELQRLGLSERQAETIENYRSKGGRFRSKADFQKMYVVSDTLFVRLEPYIEIPKLELNTADSAALVELRGIGPYYARKILDYRDRLGGYYDIHQLLEIDGIDAERFAGLAEDITVDTTKIRHLDLWHAADSILASHPYLGVKGARAIHRYRQLYDSARWTPADLGSEHVLSKENIEKLKKYIDIQ